MLRKYRQLRIQVQQLLDLLLFGFSFWAAYLFRDEFVPFRPDIEPFSSYFWLLIAIVPLVLIILPSQGFYSRSTLCSRKETVWALLRSCSLVSVGVALLMFFFREHLARSVVPLFGLFSFALVFLKEETFRLVVGSRVYRSQFQKGVILVGNRQETARIRRQWELQKPDGIKVLAEFDLDHRPISDLINLLHDSSANGVLISAGKSVFEKVEAALQACELEGVEAWLSADFFKTQQSKTSFDDIHGLPVIVFRTVQSDLWSGVIKQSFDFLGALVGLLLISPLLLVIAIAVRIGSRGPVLFKQDRCGLNGRPFTMLKFRSMVSDAEQRKTELEALNEMSGPVFKLSNDPRITRVGRFLRRHSLDELPQLINVLQGDMSLVGPRPLPVDEVKRFDDLAHRRRLSVKPGMTCTWQVSGRNNVKNFGDWVRMDLEYIDNWSLWLDFKILWRTIPAVILGVGAK